MKNTFPLIILLCITNICLSQTRTYITNIETMLWGETYLIITDAYCDNLRTIKNVYRSEDGKHIVLRAINPRYAGDTNVPIEHIQKVFLVKGKITRKQL